MVAEGLDQFGGLPALFFGKEQDVCRLVRRETLPQPFERLRGNDVRIGTFVDDDSQHEVPLGRTGFGLQWVNGLESRNLICDSRQLHRDAGVEWVPRHPQRVEVGPTGATAQARKLFAIHHPGQRPGGVGEQPLSSGGQRVVHELAAWYLHPHRMVGIPRTGGLAVREAQEVPVPVIATKRRRAGCPVVVTEGRHHERRVEQGFADSRRPPRVVFRSCPLHGLEQAGIGRCTAHHVSSAASAASSES